MAHRRTVNVTAREQQRAEVVQSSQTRGRNWQRYLEFIGTGSNWLDLWNELRWRSARPYATPEKISFPLDENQLRHSGIRWPRNYEWDGVRTFVQDLQVGLGRFVTVENAEIPQPYIGIVIIQVQVKGRLFDVVIDYSDYADIIQEEALRQSVVYFKMQFRADGYDSARYNTKKLVAGGYVPGASSLYSYVRSLRSAADQSAKVFDVYGRFGLRFSREIRRKAVGLLRAQTCFRYEGGEKRVRYSRSLAEASLSRICVDLPGNGPLCTRLVDYLGVGACIIGPRHRTILHVPLEDRQHLVYCTSDLSDLVPLCVEYLQSRDSRNELVRNSRLYFDRFLHRDQLAAYYLHQIFKAIT
jgi:hypothetical protein